MEPTCQGGGQARKATLCPVVVKRRRCEADPAPHAKAVDPGHVLEGHSFISSKDFIKDPNATRFFVKSIDEFQKEKGVPDSDTKYLLTDNCCGQFKCGKALRMLRTLGDDTKSDIHLLMETPNHGKGLSDSMGATDKGGFINEEASKESRIRQDVVQEESRRHPHLIK